MHVGWREVASSVSVLITTHNRIDLLRDRSLPSVSCQSQKPTQVILVDDSEAGQREQVKQVFFELIPESFNPIYLENNHAHGAAKAWNTGIQWALEKEPDGWVAILDDDDAWCPDHLGICASQASEEVSAVISGLVTILNGNKLEWKSPAPFSVSDFLRGNPGWQGSNTFVRGSALAAAGFFDEALHCTHDRDLAVRLLSLPGFSLKQTGVATVEYFLDTGREALTTGERKKEGLIQFWRKHCHRMTHQDKVAFRDRALALFHVPLECFP